jgi:hypothetical protein
LLVRGKNRIWGLGPEISLARASTEGAVWSILATFPLKPIRLP